MRNSSNNAFGFIPNLPILKAADKGACVSFMFYDIEKEVNGDWVDWLESIFVKFNCEPELIIMRHEGKTKTGKYIKLKKSLLLSIKNDEIDFQIRSINQSALSDFFPSEMSISINAAGLGKAQGAISIVEKRVPNIFNFSENIAFQLLQLAGNFYGHSSTFPIILGPDAYAAGVGTIPKGWSFISTLAYTKRLTAWRNETQNLNTISEYFREIFPINFLKESHLFKTIAGTPAKNFYEKHGSLFELTHNSKQYVWVVEAASLELARQILEKEGLVLSRAVN